MVDRLQGLLARAQLAKGGDATPIAMAGSHPVKRKLEPHPKQSSGSSSWTQSPGSLFCKLTQSFLCRASPFLSLRSCAPTEG